MTSTVCPQCHVRGPVRLENGAVCHACRAREAWSRWEGEGKLVIDRASIDEAEARHRGAAAPPRWLQRLSVLPALASIALAGIAGWIALRSHQPRRIGPLTLLFADLRSAGIRGALSGLLCLVVAAITLRWLHNRRGPRRLLFAAGPLVGVVVGAATLFLGGIQLLETQQGFGMEALSMPARRDIGDPSRQADRIMEATALLVAPGGDGDARQSALGTGAVIGADEHRAFLVTCSHVAMPYAAVASWRDPAAAHPVWVQLSDGRGAEGRVVWTARPPLDVALVEIAMERPPRPIEIAPDAEAALPDQPVLFVPNPLRHGWMVHRGVVVRRERHETPAGVFSLLFTDLPVQPGDSGSGLFDAFGRLVGLNTWTRVGPNGPQGISLPSDTMRSIAAAVRRGEIDRLDQALQQEHPLEGHP